MKEVDSILAEIRSSAATFQYLKSIILCSKLIVVLSEKADDYCHPY
jgi:hypothetical protein